MVGRTVRKDPQFQQGSHLRVSIPGTAPATALAENNLDSASRTSMEAEPTQAASHGKSVLLDGEKCRRNAT
jgi:hypothetical protein